MTMPECSFSAGGPRPVYLLADSRLLFRGGAEGGIPERLRAELEAGGPGPFSAAYLGASNGDEPAFYEIFEAAMEQLGVAERRFVRKRPAAGDLDFLRRADLLLLAGGDVMRGWRALEENGCAAILAERYREGALLVGVSAGAVQLGSGWLAAEEGGGERLAPTSGLLPFLVDAHDEPGWAHLRRTLLAAPDHLGGLGIPFGGAAIVAPDITVEPVGKGLALLFRQGGGVREALLVPRQPPPAAMSWPPAPAPAGGL